MQSKSEDNGAQAGQQPQAPGIPLTAENGDGQQGQRYRVHLPVFEGPLDLLLHLIEREKLDVSTVSLTQVTGQFLDYVKELEEVAAETLADFLVMAARLICIKSRLLLPQVSNSNDEEEEDPGEALARQLREYKRFREAANALRVMEESGWRSYVRIGPPPELERRLEAGDMCLADLLAAANAAFAVAPPPLPAGQMVTPFTLTIADQIRLIATATAGEKPVTFRTLLRNARHRVEIVVTLLAVLELLKRRQVTVQQTSLFGEILIVPVAGAEITVNGNGNGQNHGD